MESLNLTRFATVALPRFVKVGQHFEKERIGDISMDILDYFIPKTDIENTGLMPQLEQNYMDKHAAVTKTAEALTQNGIPVIAAWNLH